MLPRALMVGLSIVLLSFVAVDELCVLYCTADDCNWESVSETPELSGAHSTASDFTDSPDHCFCRSLQTFGWQAPWQPTFEIGFLSLSPAKAGGSPWAATDDHPPRLSV